MTMHALRPAMTLATGVAALFSACHSQSEPPVPAPAREVTSRDGVPIRFSTQGTGEPALVFVHGWTCDRTFWRQQVDEFSRTHRVVTIDLAGHGESGRNRAVWSMGAFGEDVVAVIEALKLKDVVLIGHSMGGPVIAEAASRIPDRVRGIVGVDTWQNLSVERSPEQISRELSGFRADYSAAARPYVARMFVSTTDSTLARWITERMLRTPPEIAIGAAEGVLHWNRAEATRAFGRIHVPVVTINADLFRTNIEASRSVVPSLEVKTLPGLGHFVMLEAPARFNAALAEVIAAMPALMSGR
jgi:pimeloyl-ACP methyl ester carboxylesterase